MLNVRGDLLTGTNQTPEVFRTNAPTTANTYWRMFQGGTTAGFERGQLFADPTSTHFNINAPNGDLRLFTSTVRRMNILPSLAGQTINGFLNVNLTGNVGIGLFGQPNVTQPLSMLHIDRFGTQIAGFRPWMQAGTTMTQGSDWMYTGLKQVSILQPDRTDAVINWADNSEFNPVWGPDALRFIFTRDPALTGTAAGLNGLEIARMIPDSSGNEGFVGIGDFASPALQPNERLDVLNRTIRIRRLIPDYNNDTISRVVMVDTTGRLHWRRISTFPTGGGSGGECDWQVQNETTVSPITPHYVYTAEGVSDACPDRSDLVGVGAIPTTAKLQVYSNMITDGTPGTGAQVQLLTDNTSTVNGMSVSVIPAGTLGYDEVGVSATALNGSYKTQGLRGKATVNSSSVSGGEVTGTSGEANVTAGTVGAAYALFGDAVSTAGTVTNNHGLYARA